MMEGRKERVCKGQGKVGGSFGKGKWMESARLDDTEWGVGDGRSGTDSVRIAEGQGQGDGRADGAARWASGSNTTQ